MERCLFRCCTFYQLINAINIKINILKDLEADLILNSSTNFTKIEKRLKDSGIFDRVAIMEDDLEDNRNFRKLNMQQKSEWVENIESNLVDFPFDGTIYTDYYIAVNDEYNTFVYYYLVSRGARPNVHIFEESKATYILNILEVEKKDGIPHMAFDEKNMYKNIVEILLYEPKLYNADYYNCRFTKIPQIICEEEHDKNIYNRIFGTYRLPAERYIFLVSPFFWDKFSSNEMDIIDEFAKVVGKDNIILKMHPRDQIDRYSCRGYKVMKKTDIPLEVLMMDENIDKHVLVSISSNASVTADLVLDKKVFSIMLEAFLEIGGSHAKLKKFIDLDERMRCLFNDKKLHLFTPSTYIELQETVRYIERKLGVDNAK